MLKQHYEQQLPFTTVNMAAATQELTTQQPNPLPNPDIASLSMQQQQQTNLAHHQLQQQGQQQQQQQQGTLAHISPETQLSTNGGMAANASVIQASRL